METQTMIADGLIGKTIGNYIVRHKLGEGGMGAVYLAEHPSIGKRIALKVLHAEFASQPDAVNRFFNEARAVNDIQHPNIVDIIDFGTMPPSIPGAPPTVYFMMEYIAGSTLSGLIANEAPLPSERAFAIALQIADALAECHRLGIIHRDLKPDNVMLVSRGRAHDVVKLVDFGIAKLTGGNMASTHRTRTGTVIGTPQYMSPEQCEGRGNVDHRTDIYALGIVLYEMLTGKVPFAGDGFGEVVVQQMAMPALAPSSLVARIPEHVELIVLKALEKRAGDRYQRADDLLRALRDPVSYVAAHGGRKGFLASPVLRDPALTGAGAAVAMLTPSRGRTVAPTTLRGTAAQVTTMAPVRRPWGILVGFAVAVGLALTGVAIGVIANGGDDPGGRDDPGTGSAARPAAAVPDRPPDDDPPTVHDQPPVQPAPGPPAQPAVVAPAPAHTVRVSIASRPPGATLTIAGATAGTTPYVGEIDRGSAPVEIKLTLAGYVSITRTIAPGDEVSLSLSLDRIRRPDPKPAAADPDATDDTKNPFDRLEKARP